MSISGRTRLAGVIGWPVEHSRSPAIHNAAFAATGLDWRYVALPVPPGLVPEAIEGMRALGIAGLSVTMPHKQAVAAAVDHLTPDAIALGSVNTVFRDGDRLVGDSTDGEGFVDAVAAELGLVPSGMRCAVVGAGGAARAVVLALRRHGAAEVCVVNRDRSRAASAAALAGPVGRVGTPDELGSFDLIVQATPVGMGDDRGLPFEPSLLGDDAVVVDLVYHPLQTPLLVACTARGIRSANGLGMLVHQAARQFQAWTGVAPPIDVMAAAAVS